MNEETTNYSTVWASYLLSEHLSEIKSKQKCMSGDTAQLEGLGLNPAYHKKLK